MLRAVPCTSEKRAKPLCRTEDITWEPSDSHVPFEKIRRRGGFKADLTPKITRPLPHPSADTNPRKTFSETGENMTWFGVEEKQKLLRLHYEYLVKLIRTKTHPSMRARSTPCSDQQRPWPPIRLQVTILTMKLLRSPMPAWEFFATAALTYWRHRLLLLSPTLPSERTMEEPHCSSLSP